MLSFVADVDTRRELVHKKVLLQPLLCLDLAKKYGIMDRLVPSIRRFWALGSGVKVS